MNTGRFHQQHGYTHRTLDGWYFPTSVVSTKLPKEKKLQTVTALHVLGVVQSAWSIVEYLTSKDVTRLGELAVAVDFVV
jgi:hypothetical protein